MVDVEAVISEELQRLSPFDPDERGDWQTVVDKACDRRGSRRAQRQLFMAHRPRSLLATTAVLAAVVAAPAFAFSTPLRQIFGLEYAPVGPFEAKITGVSFPKTHRYALPKVTVAFTIGERGKSPGSGIPKGTSVLVYTSGNAGDAGNQPVVAHGGDGHYRATTLAPPGGIAVVYIMGFVPSLRTPQGVYFSVPVVLPKPSSP